MFKTRLGKGGNKERAVSLGHVAGMAMSLLAIARI